MAKLLTVPEVAERLRVSVWTVYKMAQARELPAIRLVRGKLLFSEPIVEEAVRRSQTPPPATV
jgi:excisionase family DNA binding protein